ncbi:hypothetical protein JCM16303_001263 [Sporobolomyces ruberrimus]
MLAYSSKLDPLPTSPYHQLLTLPLSSPQVASTLIYNSILSSTHCVQDKYAKLQTLGDDEGIDGTVNGAHRVIEEAYGSTGCVNAMDWEQGGEERLATAGDDTKICIWKPGYTSTTRPRERVESNSPFPGYGLSETIDTGHRANIFSLKWAPQSPNVLFSAAGDCTARVYDISLSTNSSLSTTTINPSSSAVRGRLPWSHHSSSSACTSVIRCHTDRVKSISTEPYSPQTFLTCSEDGTVRQHDLRERHECRNSVQGTRPGFARLGRSGQRGGEGCPQPLADYGSMRLYSMSLSRLEPHLFVVAGTSPFAYLHDRRMTRVPMIKDWSIEPREGNLTECVRRFGVPNSEGSESFIQEQIVAVKMSSENTRDLIVSYSEKGIYRFDLHGDSYEPMEPGSSEERQGKGTKRGGGKFSVEKRGTRDEDDEEKEEDGDEGDEDEVIGGKAKKTRIDESAAQGSAEGANVSGARGVSVEKDGENVDENKGNREDSGSEARGRLGEPPPGNAVVESVPQGPELGTEESHTETEREDEDFGPPSSDEEEEEESTEPESDLFNPFPRLSPQIHSGVPVVAPNTEYTGLANSETVKDVNFACEGNLVVSGSDDGNFFCWDKESGECIGIFAGDSSVVNVLQPHPRLPFLAVSGIDQTVKIFGPTSNNSRDRSSNLVSEYETIKARNERASSGSRSGPGVMNGLPDALMRLIAARMGAPGEVGGAPGFQVVFGNFDGTGEDRAAECSVM